MFNALQLICCCGRHLFSCEKWEKLQLIFTELFCTAKIERRDVVVGAAIRFLFNVQFKLRQPLIDVVQTKRKRKWEENEISQTHSHNYFESSVSIAWSFAMRIVIKATKKRKERNKRTNRTIPGETGEGTRCYSLPNLHTRRTTHRDHYYVTNCPNSINLPMSQHVCGIGIFQTFYNLFAHICRMWSEWKH